MHVERRSENTARRSCCQGSRLLPKRGRPGPRVGHNSGWVEGLIHFRIWEASGAVRRPSFWPVFSPITSPRCPTRKQSRWWYCNGGLWRPQQAPATSAAVTHPPTEASCRARLPAATAARACLTTTAPCQWRHGKASPCTCGHKYPLWRNERPW